MCNEYGNRISYRDYVEQFSHIKLPLNFATAAPNLEPRDSIRLTDTAPIIRAAEAGARLDEVRWSWPDPKTRRLVFNMRSEGRKFSRRCLVPASCFYEFTAPEPGQAKGRKTKWRFTLAGADWFCIAGTWRPADEATPEAFSMLTCEPGPDVAPYHDRQVVVLDRASWAAWLDSFVDARDLQKPLPAGRLEVARTTP